MTKHWIVFAICCFISCVCLASSRVGNPIAMPGLGLCLGNFGDREACLEFQATGHSSELLTTSGTSVFFNENAYPEEKEKALVIVFSNQDNTLRVDEKRGDSCERAVSIPSFQSDAGEGVPLERHKNSHSFDFGISWIDSQGVEIRHVFRLNSISKHLLILEEKRDPNSGVVFEYRYLQAHLAQ